jgi:hypothetical protein
MSAAAIVAPGATGIALPSKSKLGRSAPFTFAFMVYV